MPGTVLLINGSYRPGGFTDQMLDLMAGRLEQGGFSVKRIVLREAPIEFCGNCRSCTQTEGPAYGHCVIDDAMGSLLEQIEAADGYVFASPTNFATVTALFKRFLERLVVYGYWPWGAPTPRYRKSPLKPALCVTSCAAPALIGRFAYHTIGVMAQAARCVGASVVDTLMIGMIAQQPVVTIGESDRRRILRMTEKLIRTL